MPAAAPAPAPASTVFLDASAAEPLLPEALAAWTAAHQAGWGDPLRWHRPGRLAAQALDVAREIVARATSARPEEVTFTGSGVHATHAAVGGIARGRRRIGSVIVTSSVEHSSVLAAADAYGARREVGVDAHGRVDLEAWREAVGAPGVAVAMLQVANQEVGTLQPWAEAAEVCASVGVPLVLDATAALGRIELAALASVPWAGLVGAAGAYGGPVSVGLMVLRRTARWRAPYPTDDYQRGVWPGAPDVPGIVAASVALEVWRDRDEVGAVQRGLVDRLRAGVAGAIEDVDIAGDPVRRVPHLLTFSALYCDGETVTRELDRAGFAVASGSACSATSDQPSHVLAAMGALTHGNVRLGLTRRSTKAEVDAFLAVLPGVVRQIRSVLDAR